jgi:hypothetical protein
MPQLPFGIILHNIHYANIRAGQDGTVRGMVAHLTYPRLVVAPSVLPLSIGSPGSM